VGLIHLFNFHLLVLSDRLQNIIGGLGRVVIRIDLFFYRSSEKNRFPAPVSAEKTIS
jgi:hypothetical protein